MSPWPGRMGGDLGRERFCLTEKHYFQSDADEKWLFSGFPDISSPVVDVAILAADLHPCQAV